MPPEQAARERNTDMGRMKQHPRYNVISLRVSDEEMIAITAAIGAGTRQGFLLTAALEKLANDRRKESDR